MGDSLAVRLAARDRSDEGYLDNAFTSIDPTVLPSAPQSDEQIFRISARWEPSENTQVDLKYLRSEHERLGATSVITLFQPTANLPALDTAGYALNGALYPNAPLGEYYRSAFSIGGAALSGSQRDIGGPGERPEGTETENDEWSLNIKHDLNDTMSISWTSGYSEYYFEDGLDADWGPLRFIGRSDDQEFDQQSHEFRLSSASDNLFWTVGVNYLESTQKIDRLTVLDGTFGSPATVQAIFGLPSAFAYSPAQLAGVNAPNPALGGASLANLAGLQAVTPGMPGISMFSAMGGMADWTQDTESYAIFGQVSFDLTDTLNLTAGVRYTEEKKDVVAITDITFAERGIAEAVDYAPIAPGFDIGAYLGHELLAALLGRYETGFVQNRKTDQVLPGVSLAWTPSDTSNFYITYSEGFKSGGFNAAIDQNPVFAVVGGQRVALRDQPGAGFEFDDETGKSLEIGGKHQFLDGDMIFNWNVFVSEYKDQQVSTFQGTGFVIANAGSSTSNGIEVDMQWQVTDKFRVIAALGLLDAEYDEFDGAACTAQQSSALLGLARAEPGGVLTPNSPVTSALGCDTLFQAGARTGESQSLAGGQLGSDYSGSIILEYNQPLTENLMWFTQFDANFTDGYYMTGDLDPIDYQDAYELYNFRTGLRTDNWMIMAYGRNIGDKFYATGSADLPVALGSHFQYTGTTEQYGVQVAYEF